MNNNREFLKELKSLWDEYKKDPEIMYAKEPINGVLYTFEGFWLWLLQHKKYE